MKRDGQVVPYDRDRIETAILRALASLGQGDRSVAAMLAQQVEEMLAAAYGPAAAPTVEDIQDIVERVLMMSGRAEAARAYIIYRHERARLRDARARRIEATDNIPYRVIYEVLRWNLDHECASIADLNRRIAEGRYAELVRDAEARYEAEVRTAASRIIERRADVRLVIVAGPSSSGKTTTTIKLSEHLAAAGLKLRALNLDNYFFDLEQHPRDEFGDYDYETPQALDIELINRHLTELLAGREIQVPRYDFKTGRRTLNVSSMRLEPDELLLLDSLHGLYGPMTSSVPAERKFRVYIETLEQIRNAHGEFLRWADLRMMRRMVRDAWHRNHRPLETITHWHYVRASELKYIIPFISEVDFIVNSALPHELPILKPRVWHVLPEAIRVCRDEPRRQDAYLRAKRLYEWLEPLTPIESDEAIPSRSLLREFIGGSSYDY
ncbi:MAG: ATP cone domain-containing protein [Kiritimatiellae bacterium]|nr:ATP cone domain-containing protein [Kiritimatiellia bacterium]